MRNIFLLTTIAFISLSAGRIAGDSLASRYPFTTLADVTFSSGTINQSIPDENAAGYSNTLNVTGIPVGSTIDSVIVTFTVTHTFLSDVVINLEAPNSQVVNLVANEGGVSTYGYTDTRVTSNTSIQAFPSGDYSSTLTGTFRADAASQTTLDSYTFKTLSGSTSPAVTTSTFSNLFATANGNWTIHVYDVSAGDIGTLVSWSIKISFTPIVTPVTLLTFSGYRENNHNVLKWSTASEQINKGFQIERSINGISYSSIGFVNSKAQNGNSSSLLQYSFNDNNVSDNKQYYRLRQIDIDNHEKMSNIIVIKSQRPISLHLDGLFPNPAKNIVNAIIDVPTGDIVDLVITDMNGKLIRRQSSSVDAGTNTIPIDISRLPGGVYSIKILSKSNNEMATEKFMKQ